ncbi:hypothetical protein EVG20_g2652 [Dentipellis fragilis]|uniref:Uncharacterized protein n=1 Tax=Dentipellis fragilis TaxID=205917 RepID=A0A4Y9Z968_9AGAM|nr:hypothetical protein EVG20_g2652 [Dentipellis fragilis]
MQSSFGPLDPSLVGGLGDTDIDLAAYAQGLEELGISASDPMDFLGAPNAGMPDMGSPVSHFDIVGTDMGVNVGMGMDLDLEAFTANMDIFPPGFSVDPSVLQQQPSQSQELQQEERPMASLADGFATSEAPAPAAEPRFSFDFNDMIHDL